MTKDRSTLRILVLLAVLFVLVFICLKQVRSQYPGEYPKILPEIGGTFSFQADRIEIVLTEQPKSGVVFVFAYDEGNNFLGILKPVTDRKVVLGRGDLADVRAPVKGQEVGEPVFLKRMDRYAEKIDIFEKVVQAHDRGGRYGVQRCLHPVCTKCVDACKTVISSGDLAIVMGVQKGGFILPEFSKGKCPRCGRCFTDCPTGSIERSPGRQH